MSKTKLELLKIRFKRYVPPILPISFAAALITLVIYLVGRVTPAFADAVNRWYGSVLRFVFAKITGLLPFSLAEGLLMASPVLLAVLIGLAVRFTKHSLRAGMRYVCVLLSVVCILFTLFVPMLGIGSSASPLSDRLGIAEEKVSAVQLAETMQWAINEANKLCGDVDFAAIEPKASAITPVPGGVGPMTITCLMENTIECFLRKMIQRKFKSILR